MRFPNFQPLAAAFQSGVKRQTELDARKKTNAMHSASVDAVEQQFAQRPVKSLSTRANDGAVRTGQLSTRKAVPVGGGGRSATDKLGMLARRAWTRQDEKGYTDLIQAQAGLEQRGIDRAFSADQNAQQRDFARERDAVNFDQSIQMRGIDQEFITGRDEQRRQDALDAEKRGNQREDQNWQRNRAAELQDRAAGGIDGAFIMQTPDGSGGVPMVKDRSGNARMAGGFMPNRPTTTPPTAGEIAKHISDNLAKGIIASYDPKKGGYTYEPLKPDKPQSDGSESTVEEQDANGNWEPRTRTTTKRLGMPDQGSLTGRKGGGYW